MAGPKFGAGTLRAAARQGVDEIGMALKAFASSIQADEPGTLWSPTQGEIAAGNRGETIESRLQTLIERTAGRERDSPDKGMDRE